MSDDSNVPFTTVAMAEILLIQDLVKEASEVIARLEKQHPNDKRVTALRKRLGEKKGVSIQEPKSLNPKNTDSVALSYQESALHINWELTSEGLDIAKRVVRYSGETIIRLFTAAPGPRGVRTTIKDIDISILCGTMELTGTPFNASHTAAVGFLGRNGAFIPMAHARPVYGHSQ